MKKYKGSPGWFKEPYRHSLAAKGIKTSSMSKLRLNLMKAQYDIHKNFAKQTSTGTTYNIIDKVINNDSQIKIPLGEKLVGIDKTRTGEIQVSNVPFENSVMISVWIAEQKPISIDRKTMGVTKIINNRNYIRSVKTDASRRSASEFLSRIISESKSKVSD